MHAIHFQVQFFEECLRQEQLSRTQCLRDLKNEIESTSLGFSSLPDQVKDMQTHVMNLEN